MYWNAKMHIVYLHQYFLTPDMAGGTRSFEMAKRWVSAGHKVTVITTDQSRGNLGRGWKETSHDGISVHWLRVPYSNEMGFWKRMGAFLHFALRAGSRAIKLGGDVIFATSTPLTIAIPAIQASRSLNVPMVFEVRDLWPEIPIALGVMQSPLLIFLAKRLENLAYQSASFVIALSEGMADGVARSGYPADRISVVPNSCDVDIFQNKASELPFILQGINDWLTSGEVVLYAGTIGKINGLRNLVDIAIAARDSSLPLRFLIVGDGAERQLLRLYAQQHGVLGNYVRFLDPLPKKDVPALMNIATVATSFFLPLKQMESNSANKFFDALAAGKPLVINYGGWQKQVLDSAGAGLSIEGLDATDAAKIISDFATDKLRLESAGAAALQLARNHFDRNQLALKVLNILERVTLESRSQ